MGGGKPKFLLVSCGKVASCSRMSRKRDKCGMTMYGCTQEIV